MTKAIQLTEHGGPEVLKLVDIEVDELFEVVRKGEVKILVEQRYPLAQAAQAHRDLESRRTTGSTVFVV